MNVVYEGEQVEPLPVYKWKNGPYYNEHMRRYIDTFWIRSYRITNPLIASDVLDSYQVVLPNGEKVKCYRSDDKLIEFSARKRTRKI